MTKEKVKIVKSNVINYLDVLSFYCAEYGSNTDKIPLHKINTYAKLGEWYINQFGDSNLEEDINI